MGNVKRKSINLVGSSGKATAAKPRKRKMVMKSKSRRAGAGIKGRARGSARSTR